MDGSLSFSKDGDTQNKYIPATHAHDGAPRKKKKTHGMYSLRPHELDVLAYLACP